MDRLSAEMNNFLIYFHCINACGKKRKKNEDNFFADGNIRKLDLKNDIRMEGSFSSDGHNIVAVFDGMGGEACGEIASFLAARDLAEYQFDKSQEPESYLKNVIRTMNKSICSHAAEIAVDCMGTTAALLFFESCKIHACNVGDSRIYRIRNRRIKQISVDHVANSINGRKAPLSQFLGIPEDVYHICPHIRSFSYRAGDRYLICSDGLTDMLSDNEILSIVNKSDSVSKVSEELYEAAMNNGGKDNITIIFCGIEAQNERRSLFNGFTWFRNI